MNRRKFLQAMMAGSAVAAADLWIPGQKLISIPSGKVYTGGAKIIIGNGTDEVVYNVSDGPVTIEEFYQYVMNNCPRGGDDLIPFKNPLRKGGEDDLPNLFVLEDNWHIDGVRHLTNGSLVERSTDSYWTSFTTIGDHIG